MNTYSRNKVFRNNLQDINLKTLQNTQLRYTKYTTYFISFSFKNEAT
jgi:hypothetical protein